MATSMASAAFGAVLAEAMRASYEGQPLAEELQGFFDAAGGGGEAVLAGYQPNPTNHDADGGGSSVQSTRSWSGDLVRKSAGAHRAAYLPPGGGKKVLLEPVRATSECAASSFWTLTSRFDDR